MDTAVRDDVADDLSIGYKVLQPHALAPGSRFQGVQFCVWSSGMSSYKILACQAGSSRRVLQRRTGPAVQYFTQVTRVMRSNIVDERLSAWDRTSKASRMFKGGVQQKRRPGLWAVSYGPITPHCCCRSDCFEDRSELYYII